MTPNLLLSDARRHVVSQTRQREMSIQRTIDRMVGFPPIGKRAGVEIQLLLAVDEGAVEFVGLHLVRGVEAIATVLDAGSMAFAVRSGVDGELELVEERAFVDSEGVVLVVSVYPALVSFWRPEGSREAVTL